MRDELIPQPVTPDIAVNPLEILSKLCQLSHWNARRDRAIALPMFTDLLHWFLHDARIWVTEIARPPPLVLSHRVRHRFFRIVRRYLGPDPRFRAAAGAGRGDRRQ